VSRRDASIKTLNLMEKRPDRGLGKREGEKDGKKL